MANEWSRTTDVLSPYRANRQPCGGSVSIFFALKQAKRRSDCLSYSDCRFDSYQAFCLRRRIQPLRGAAISIAPDSYLAWCQPYSKCSGTRPIPFTCFLLFPRFLYICAVSWWDNAIPGMCAIPLGSQHLSKLFSAMINVRACC